MKNFYDKLHTGWTRKEEEKKAELGRKNNGKTWPTRCLIIGLKRASPRRSYLGPSSSFRSSSRKNTSDLFASSPCVLVESILSAMTVELVGVVVDVTEDPGHVLRHIGVHTRQPWMCTENPPRHNTAVLCEKGWKYFMHEQKWRETILGQMLRLTQQTNDPFRQATGRAVKNRWKIIFC